MKLEVIVPDGEWCMSWEDREVGRKCEYCRELTCWLFNGGTRLHHITGGIYKCKVCLEACGIKEKEARHDE